jgi:hypothetical protein
MDFPKVTVVIQVGPSPPELYIQRRTFRSRWQQRQGILLLVEEEKMAMLNALKNKVRKHRNRVLAKQNHDCYSEADQGFKSLIGAYNTEARMLKWQMKDIVPLSRVSSLARVRRYLQ